MLGASGAEETGQAGHLEWSWGSVVSTFLMGKQTYDLWRANLAWRGSASAGAKAHPAVPTSALPPAHPPHCPHCPHLQAGVVGVGRQRELRTAVVSQLRVQEQVVLALVAPCPGSGRGRATPPGPERRALGHGRSVRKVWGRLPPEGGVTTPPGGTDCAGARSPAAALVLSKLVSKGQRVREVLQTP